MLDYNKYSKIFCVDTNIILSDYKNVELLASNNNLVVVSHFVLEELDKFKTGMETINYNAREFVRLLDTCDYYKEIAEGIVVFKKKNLELIILNFSNINHKVMDNCIIEEYSKFINMNINIKNKINIISNDSIFKIKAITEGYQTDTLHKDRITKSYPSYKEYTIKEQLLNKNVFKIDELELLISEQIPDSAVSMCIVDITGRPTYLIRDNSETFLKFNPDSIKPLFKIGAKNIEQKLLWEMLLNNNNDVVVVDAIAGTGKTLSFLLGALQLVKNKYYDKITYIRKTIISGNKQDELGFLPGSLNEKMMGYLYPLKDNIEFIIRHSNKKKKSWTQDELNEAIKKFEKDYNINYEYMGHLRGRTLSGIIIIDEAQNFSIQDITTILSRIKDGSRVFIGGSTKQIDNPYLNKYNNALTFLKSHIGTFEDIKIKGIKLTKVERGKITDWIEKVTKK